MGNRKITVIKANGEKEEFSESKVRSSIRRAKIASELEEQVVQHVKSILYENIPTSQIYKHIIEFLGKSSYPAASARYSLKQAIMQLGPTGYPFEKFIAAVLQHHRYTVKTNQSIQGKCVTHEIDVVAIKDRERFMIEAKFHNRSGTRSNIKVALYTWARFNDLGGFTKPWLVTNTKATLDAINYGRCMGMRVTSWSYPKQDNLRDLIQKANLHPITTLTSLSQKQKSLLLENNIVLCRQVADIEDHKLLTIGITKQQAKKTMVEAKQVCN
jgi:predicted RecB family endonuclease